MNFKRTAISLALGLAVLAIGYFFFSKKTIDNADLEQKLTANAAQNLKAPEDKISVDCPDDEESKQGNKFDCNALIDGKPLILGVEITSDDGNYTVTPQRPGVPAPN